MTSFTVDGAGHIGVIGPLMGSVTVAGNEVDAVKTRGPVHPGQAPRMAVAFVVRRLTCRAALADGRTIGLRAIAGDPRAAPSWFVGRYVRPQYPCEGMRGPIRIRPRTLSTTLLCQGGTDLVVARINGSDGTIGKNSTNEDWADQVGV